MINIHAAKAALSSNPYPNNFNDSSLKHQTSAEYPEFLPQTEKLGSEEQSWTQSADSQIQHQTTQSSPAANSL